MQVKHKILDISSSVPDREVSCIITFQLKKNQTTVCDSFTNLHHSHQNVQYVQDT